MSHLPLVFILLFLAICASYGDDLTDLGECTRDIVARDTYLASQIPPAVLASDRKLLNMRLGVRVLEQNMRYLAERRSLSSPDTLMIANALEGCRTFRNQFTTRIAHFRLFLFCLVGLVSVLTLRSLFIILPRFIRRSAHADLDPSTSGNYRGRRR